MAHQASVNGGVDDRVPIDPASAMVANLAGFGNDIANLAELQSKLAALDFAESRRRAMVPAGLLAAVGWLVISLPPVLMIGFAELLVDYAGWPRSWALLTIGVGTLIFCGFVVAMAGPALSRSFESFRRSRDELSRNISWIRTVLVHSGRGSPNRR